MNTDKSHTINSFGGFAVAGGRVMGVSGIGRSSARGRNYLKFAVDIKITQRGLEYADCILR